MDIIKVDEVINEYKRPLPMLHLIAGIGVGVFLSGLFPMIAYQGLVLGLILIAVGVGGKYFLKKQRIES